MGLEVGNQDLINRVKQDPSSPDRWFKLLVHLHGRLMNNRNSSTIELHKMRDKLMHIYDRATRDMQCNGDLTEAYSLVWLQHAALMASVQNMAEEARDVFKYMKTNCIATEIPWFYLAYAKFEYGQGETFFHIYG